MSAIRKFSIDTYFSASGEILSEGGGAARAISPEEHAGALKEAYEAGKNDELARVEQAIAAELRALNTAVGALSSSWRHDLESLFTGAVTLAMAAARTAAGGAIDRFGEETIRDALEHSLAALGETPRLVVRTPTALADRVAPMLEELLDRAGIASTAYVRADPRLGAGQAMIEWPEGAIALDAAQHIERIEHLIRERMAHPGAETLHNGAAQ
jgi:flagellar assembly protein FliH